MHHSSLFDWMLSRPQRVDKTTMLLEHYLVLHYTSSGEPIKATRKEICDYTGWTYKTVNKAIATLDEMGLWSVTELEHARELSFTPIFAGYYPKMSSEKLTSLIWQNSSLSGTTLMIALAYAHLFDGLSSEASLREVSKITGRSTNTVRDCIQEMVDSGEWRREMSGYKTILKPNIGLLSESHSSNRTVELREKTGATLPPARRAINLEKNPKNFNLPYYSLDLKSMNKDNIAPFIPLRTYKAYAQRLISITPFEERSDIYKFTVPRLTDMYEKLVNIASPETVDTLLTYQVLTGRAIDMKFLKHVLNRVNRNGLRSAPVLFSHDKDDSGAYQTALAVWSILKARRSSSI